MRNVRDELDGHIWDTLQQGTIEAREVIMKEVFGSPFREGA